MRLIYLGAAWLSGLYLGYVSFHPPVWFYLAIAAALLVLFMSHRTRDLLLAVLCLALAAAGFWRAGTAALQAGGENLSRWNGLEAVEITGTIQVDPEILDRGVRFVLEAQEVSTGPASAPASGQALIYGSLLPPRNNSRPFPYWRYGDKLKIRGRLEAPASLESENYREYLAGHGITSLVRFPERMTFVSPDASPLLSPIYELRTALSKGLRSVLREPEASLAQGILLGIRTGIPDSLSNAFAHTGTTHVLAISGQNLTIIAGLVTGLAVWLLGRRRQLYIFLSLAVVWFYATLTGLVPSVVRAAVMASVFLLAHLAGRPRSGGPATVFAAGLMAGWQPSILADVSFQLSFLAILGLIYLAPRLQALWAGLAESGQGWWRKTLIMVLNALAVSFAATLFTLPVLAYRFHTVSLVSLPATLILLPVLPAIILLSGATALLGLAAPLAALLVGGLAWLPLSYMVTVVTLFDRLPLAFAAIGPFGGWFLPGSYALLAGAVWFAGDPARRFSAIRSAARSAFLRAPVASIAFAGPGKWMAAALPVAAFFAFMGVLNAPDGRLHLTFFGPEQGEAVLVQSPGGRIILVDGGRSPETLNLALGKALPFWKRDIDLVVVTSPDSSQLPALIDVLRRYRVDQVWEAAPGSSGAVLPAGYREWQRELKHRNIPTVVAASGQYVGLEEGYKLRVLDSPQADSEQPGPDVTSQRMVLRLEAGQVSFLLTPPPDPERVRSLARRGIAVQSTVLRASGKPDSASLSALAEALTPQVLVTPGEPGAGLIAIMSSGAPALPGGEPPGALEFITDGESLWLKKHGR
ncbi:MAG: ComEC/Rec2 family competence protein [Chloroflexi bacterium]|nr:ComEC/Rec2 family competence protein [Chloroflexota bacterium]